MGAWHGPTCGASHTEHLLTAGPGGNRQPCTSTHPWSQGAAHLALGSKLLAARLSERRGSTLAMSVTRQRAPIIASAMPTSPTPAPSSTQRRPTYLYRGCAAR